MARWLAVAGMVLCAGYACGDRVLAVETQAVTSGRGMQGGTGIAITDGGPWACGLWAWYGDGGLWYGYRKTLGTHVDMVPGTARTIRLEVTAAGAWGVYVDNVLVASGIDQLVRVYDTVLLSAHGYMAGHDATAVRTETGMEQWDWTSGGDLFGWYVSQGLPDFVGGHLWGTGDVQMGRAY